MNGILVPQPPDPDARYREMFNQMMPAEITVIFWCFEKRSKRLFGPI